MHKFLLPFYESLLLFLESDCVCFSNLASAAFRALSLRSVKSVGEELLDGFALFKLYPVPENVVESRFIEARVGTAKEDDWLLFPDPLTGEPSNSC